MIDLLACAVCYGEPGNPLTEGAKWGVIFLGGVIFSVLSCFAGVFIFWSRRAAALERGDLQPPTIP